MDKEIYEISSKTCALISKNKHQTEIIEEDKIITLDKPVNKIIKESCEYYGSSFEGRLKGSKTMLGMCYKLPIIIESSREMIFFPTTSPLNQECCWISIKNIKEYEAFDNNVIIKFKGNHTKMFPLTYESLENQMFRSTKLMLILKNRKNN